MSRASLTCEPGPVYKGYTMTMKKPKARPIDIAIRFPAQLRGLKEKFRKRAAASGLDMNALAILLIQDYLNDKDKTIRPGSRPG
jgi:hypothetical protein